VTASIGGIGALVTLAGQTPSLVQSNPVNAGQNRGMDASGPLRFWNDAASAELSAAPLRKIKWRDGLAC
jgi:hypothetical protein